MKETPVETGYGPLADTANISPYLWFSEEAHRVYARDIGRNGAALSSGHSFVLHLLLSNSKNTSFSIRMLSTWAQPNDALVLLKTRLEQLIVSSYLIHQNEPDAIDRFVSCIPGIRPEWSHGLTREDMVREGISLLFPEMGAHLPKLMEEIASSVRGSSGTVRSDHGRKWTPLDTAEIVRERDAIVDKSDLISSYQLGYYHGMISGLTAGLVHADPASVSPAFLVTTPDNSAKPHEVYIISGIALNAHLDIIHCHETSKKMGLLNEKDYFQLYEKYLRQVKSDFGFEG